VPGKRELEESKIQRKPSKKRQPLRPRRGVPRGEMKKERKNSVGQTANKV